jgi:PAS domain S-box-containing protein
MNIPIIPAVAMVFGITSAVISLAMFFLVLWQAPRNRDNQLMAFYMVTVIVWGLSVFVGHFLGLLGQTIPSGWVVYSVVLARSFNALFLFALVTHYASLWRNRWIQGILLASVGYRFLIVIPLLFQGQLYNQFILFPSGQTSFHIESLGYILLFINNLYYLATLAVLWVFRHQRTKQLLVGTIILLVGVLITPTQLRVYSPVIINAAIAGIFFTYAILQENLFNPLVKLNEALQESEEKYRSLTNQLPIGVYRTSRDGEIVYANPALAIILGYEKVEDLIKTSAADAYVDPDQRNKQLGQWKASAGVIGSEVKLRTKDGKEIWVRDTGRVILDESGEIDYVDGTIEDIRRQNNGSGQ